MKKLTTENFIEKACKIHGNKYDYSKVKYINNLTKVCIICPEHGEFWQVSNYHLSGNGCPKCGKEKIWVKRGRTTTDDFINKAHGIHGFKYDYSKVEYNGALEKVCIICPEHGEFWQTPNNHINNKRGCPKCGNKKSWDERGRITINDFIEKAKKVHGNKYDYSKAEYVNTKTKVCIICPEHGEFWQTPAKHLNGQGCPKCGVTNIWDMRGRTTNSDFIEAAKEVHGDKYDYSKVVYKRRDTKVCIICPEHGEFWQTPAKHLNGQGCPVCSKIYNVYEYRLYETLKKNFPNTEIIYQYKNKKIYGRKSIDIFFPSLSVGVEYQGAQHFKPIKIWGGEKNFKQIAKRDLLKWEESVNNDIKLYYFTYNQKDIPEKYFTNIISDVNVLINEIKNKT